jgi:amino acid transporter
MYFQQSGSLGGLDNFGSNIRNYFSLKLLLQSTAFVIIISIIIIIIIILYCSVQCSHFKNYCFSIE